MLIGVDLELFSLVTTHVILTSSAALPWAKEFDITIGEVKLKLSTVIE